jgi:predicted nucleotidyltransferase/uncharacterized protein with HEPN domain
MVDASKKAIALVSDISLEQYTAAENFALRAATERLIGIACGAAHHVSNDLKAQLSEIPWRQIADMRNHLTYGYVPKDNEFVWKAATEHVPHLLAELEPLLRTLPKVTPAIHAKERGTSPRATAWQRGSSDSVEDTDFVEDTVFCQENTNRVRVPGQRAMTPTRDYVLEELYKVRATLRTFGVRNIAVFGSVARNTARAASDIDIVVDIQRGQITLDNLLGLQDFLKDHFQRKVDVITESSLKSFSRDLIMRDAVFLEGLHEVEMETEQPLSRA